MIPRIMRKVLVTGATGQDGYFLCDMLCSRNEVHVMVRRNSSNSLGTLEFLPMYVLDNIIIHWGDITDAGFVDSLIRMDFDQVYHLAAMSYVGYSFLNPSNTFDVNLKGTVNVLEAIRRLSPETRMYFAGSSEMYGKPEKAPQNEDTPFAPRSPYAVSKVAAFHMVRNYRDGYGLHVCSGIAFNHESEVRGPEFVTQKIARYMADMRDNGYRQPLKLGNLNAKKDWGFAGDFVEAMTMMLDHGATKDYVIGTGEMHTVREFATLACRMATGQEIRWEGAGLNEKGYVGSNCVVEVDRSLFRPLEADNYMADASRIAHEIGWRPKMSFSALVRRMVEKARLTISATAARRAS